MQRNLLLQVLVNAKMNVVVTTHVNLYEDYSWLFWDKQKLKNTNFLSDTLILSTNDFYLVQN